MKFIDNNKIPLFTVVKYDHYQKKLGERYFIVGYDKDRCYNITIYKNGYARPNYNLPISTWVIIDHDFDVRNIIKILYENEIDSRWIEILNMFGIDNRNLQGE